MSDLRANLAEMGFGDVGRQFATTQWSVVLSAGDRGTAEGRRAMETLCASYWYPLYAYARRKGCDVSEAEDVTQGFLAQFIERDCVAGVRREKGKFRTFLLVCLKNYMTNLREAQSTTRRGGGTKTMSFDAAEAEDRYRMELADETTAERAFERNWALAVLERALAQVGAEFAARGRERIFEALRVYLTGDELAPTYASTAMELSMSETGVKVAVHRLRERYRLAVEEEIRQTIDEKDAESSMEQEIGELLAALSEARRAR